jgi:hypothetical protein
MFKLEVDLWQASQARILNQLCMLNELGVPAADMCLGGSAAMVLMELRNDAGDINVWVNSPYFERLAEDHKVLVHPLRDSVVRIPETDLCVRRRNHYFKSHTLENGIDVFGELTLLIQKRSSYIEPGRSVEQKQQDFRDIKLLNDILATRNQVAS